MQFTRRFLLQGAALSTIAPQLVWAQSSLTADGARLDTLSDGNLVLPKSFSLGDVAGPEADEILARYGLTGDSFEPDCNVTLLRSGDRTILFDVGAGPDFMPTAGKLMDAFDMLGVDPFDVTDVVFTHAHPDHIWGLLDDFGDLNFPDANYHIGQKEYDYWTDPNTVSTIGEARQTFAVGAANRLGILADRINLFGDGAEIAPGVAARATHGHTPGHMAFEVRLGSESAMIVGDSILNNHLAFERPTWRAGSDQDQDMAVATRVSLLDQLATEQMRMIGYHLPGGGMGRVERRADSYVFVGEDA
ncbi:MBL fold metallo-hydrolase [Yoonia sediminilitoris]|uniref:Glyoxylase-like metal-dependent hydrolase (Beta-lactamase superfamily II) n=1 Tax=Yoonia sediminilitoris TaxID=1286148 RepID=A0A2T6KQV6_9RHOB|nr:MBL fold metallo-hydrolase [Yoonia sediminilitoris]PUB18931.1 glyoxylase-like metal-dependent hydrolase (beta-lactamase superfamily II) [Yoonia sediminilitoris]RCW99099.1 glyoxylase-like metal-dependent hydrolase (beta-lactamase superfamily II) [Yoonia sediminilitoris]